MTGGAFICVWCYDTGEDPVVRYKSDQFVIEVAAKSNDGRSRASQVSTFRLCRRHANEYVEDVKAAFHHGLLPKGWAKVRVDAVGQSGELQFES